MADGTQQDEREDGLTMEVIERAIGGMRPVAPPVGVTRVAGMEMGWAVMDAPGYAVYRDRAGALWVEVVIGLTGDVCWYGPVDEGNAGYAELLRAVDGKDMAGSERQSGGASGRIARVVAGVVILAAALPGVATLLGFLGAIAWWLDLFSHFRLQYFVSLTIAALILMVLKSRRMAGVFGVLALVNLALIVPLYFGRDRAAAGPVVRAMLMNVNQRMGDPRRVAEVIGEVDPDLVVLEEVSGKWMQDLAATIARYPYTRLEPREDNFGIALLSRFPLAESRVVMIGDAGVPSIVAEVQTLQGRCTVVATHPFPPVNAECSAYRNGQHAGLAQEAKKATSPVILLGDLNCTVWSPYFGRLVRESGLKDSSRGWGVQPSWPADRWVLRIPIDHCLHSPGVRVVRREIGPDVGSDHFPLIVEMQLP